MSLLKNALISENFFNLFEFALHVKCILRIIAEIDKKKFNTFTHSIKTISKKSILESQTF